MLRDLAPFDTRHREAIAQKTADLGAGRPEVIYGVGRMDRSRFPDAADVPFIQQWRSLYETTQEEADGCAWSIRVFPDDTVELVKTVGEMKSQTWQREQLRVAAVAATATNSGMLDRH